MDDSPKLNLCIILLTVIFALMLPVFRDVDEHNMDVYDRLHGISDGSRTRGVFGTIYDSEGNVDTWATFTDHNSYWR